jgi:hypothetical protein
MKVLAALVGRRSSAEACRTVEQEAYEAMAEGARVPGLSCYCARPSSEQRDGQDSGFMLVMALGLRSRGHRKGHLAVCLSTRSSRPPFLPQR